MPDYVWKGRTSSGAIQSGELTAKNPSEVFAALRTRKIIPTSVKVKSRKLTFPLVGMGRGRFSAKEIALFTRQFATMINAGLPLMQCLEVQAQQADRPQFRRILTEVMSDVERGSTLAEALKKHRAFGDLYVNMVEAGEAGGALDVIMLRLANYLEKAAALRRKIRGAMVYPSVIAGVAVVMLGVLLGFLVPKIAEMFTMFEGDLPLPTVIVVNLSNMVKHWFPVIILALAGLVVGIYFWYQTPRGREVIDRTLLRFPIFGSLIRRSSISRFARTLSTLLSSGVPILDAMDITARTAGNWVVENAVMKARSSISEGETISEPIKSGGIFPPMVTQMIAVGEATGGLDDMLAKIADFYDAEVDDAVENLTSAIEPIVMVFLGVIVGGIVISMYLPIFKLATLIR
jgi:type IV pilus assembly protein PilC